MSRPSPIPVVGDRLPHLRINPTRRRRNVSFLVPTDTRPDQLLSFTQPRNKLKEPERNHIRQKHRYVRNSFLHQNPFEFQRKPFGSKSVINSHLLLVSLPRGQKKRDNTAEVILRLNPTSPPSWVSFSSSFLPLTPPTFMRKQIKSRVRYNLLIYYVHILYTYINCLLLFLISTIRYRKGISMTYIFRCL